MVILPAGIAWCKWRLHTTTWPRDKSLCFPWASCVESNNILPACVSEAAEEPLEWHSDNIQRGAAGWKQLFFFTFFFFHRPESTAIYFNDENELCSHVGLLRRFLILPGSNKKHWGDLHNLHYEKDYFLSWSVVLYMFSSACNGNNKHEGEFNPQRRCTWCRKDKGGSELS